MIKALSIQVLSGDTSKGVLDRIVNESKIRVGDNNVLVLSIGVNDSQYEMVSGKNKIAVHQTIHNLTEAVSVSSHLFDKIVVVGIAPVWDTRIQPMAWKPTHGYSNEHISRYNTALQKFAQSNAFQFIELSDVYDDVDQCLPDGIHPNAHGHQLIFERVRESLEKEHILQF